MDGEIPAGAASKTPSNPARMLTFTQECQASTEFPLLAIANEQQMFEADV
jgi:hypothetical protein